MKSVYQFSPVSKAIFVVLFISWQMFCDPAWPKHSGSVSSSLPGTGTGNGELEQGDRTLEGYAGLP